MEAFTLHVITALEVLSTTGMKVILLYCQQVIRGTSIPLNIYKKQEAITPIQWASNFNRYTVPPFLIPLCLLFK